MPNWIKAISLVLIITVLVGFTGQAAYAAKPTASTHQHDVAGDKELKAQKLKELELKLQKQGGKVFHGKAELDSWVKSMPKNELDNLAPQMEQIDADATYYIAVPNSVAAEYGLTASTDSDYTLAATAWCPEHGWEAYLKKLFVESIILYVFNTYIGWGFQKIGAICGAILDAFSGETATGCVVCGDDGEPRVMVNAGSYVDFDCRMCLHQWRELNPWYYSY